MPDRITVVRQQAVGLRVIVISVVVTDSENLLEGSVIEIEWTPFAVFSLSGENDLSKVDHGA